MWIERVEIGGFRRLSGSFSFSSELTVVLGDNESGKSSLHEALIRTLFGFSKPERRRSRGASQLERFAPWDGNAYGLVATLRDEEGRAHRIEWDFAKHRVKLVDDLGKDISDRVRGKNEEVTLGQFLLGVGLDDFREVCCIDQVALSAVRHSPSLGVALQEAVANIGGDTPVEHAVERMNEFLRASIGARIDNLNPSPTGKLSVFARERTQLTEELRAAEETRAELVTLASELGKEKEELNELVAAQEQARQRLLLTEARQLEERLEKATRLRAEGEDRPAGETLPQDTVDAVKTTLSRLDDLAVEVDDVEREVEAVAEDVAKLESEQRRLTAAVDGLDAYASADVSARDRVHDLWAQLEALRTKATDEPAAAPPRDPMLARYREERQELFALAVARRRSRVRQVLWILLVVLTLGIALLVGALMRRIRGPRPTSGLSERLAPYGVSTLEELDDRVAAEDLRLVKAEAVAEALRRERDQKVARERELEVQIRTKLDAVQAPDAPSLAQRVSAYRTAAARHAERRDHEAELDRVRRELEEKRRPAHDRRRLHDERERLRMHLGESYGALGVDAADLEAARVAFDRLLTTDAEARKLEQKAQTAARALAEVLGGETIEMLGQRVEDARRRHTEHRVEFSELANEPGSPEGLKDKVGQYDTRLREEREVVTSLETRIAALEDDSGNPAELKEQLDEVEGRIDRLDEAKEAIRLARETLVAAADELKRQFAPHLNEALRRSLPRLTGGRYGEGMIDGDLRVSVVAPETGHMISADELSRATKDQIFLVERLEIARLLAPTKRPAPLLLDDPFAHYDHERLRQGLEVIRETARERQVIVFSEDRGLVELAAGINGGCQIIELPSP